MTTQPHLPGDRYRLASTAPRPDTTPDDEMLDIHEAARFLRVPEGTLRYWRHLGIGPRSFKVGRHIRYWRSDLILWLTEQTEHGNQHDDGRLYPQPEVGTQPNRRTREGR